MEDYISTPQVRGRLPWMIVAVVLIFGLSLYLVWPYLWIGRALLIVLGIGGTLRILVGWYLQLHGTHLEQQKMSRVINPVEGRLPAVIRSDGYVAALEPPPLPTGFKYVYQVRNNIPTSALPVAETPLALPEHIQPVAPEFHKARRQFKEGELILGYTGLGEPVRLGYEQTKSVGLIGKSGTGKSTTLRWLAAQIGGEMHVWDPHASIGLPGAKFEHEEMLEDGQYLEGVYEERKKLFAKGTRSFTPVLLVVDEWKELYKPLKAVKGLVSNFITGGRKFGMHLLIASQYFKATMFEGSGDLDSIWTRYLHWTDSRQAEYARASEDSTTEMLDLVKKWGPAGYVVLSNPHVESTILAVPNVGEEVFR